MRNTWLTYLLVFLPCREYRLRHQQLQHRFPSFAFASQKSCNHVRKTEANTYDIIKFYSKTEAKFIESLISCAKRKFFNSAKTHSIPSVDGFLGSAPNHSPNLSKRSSLMTFTTGIMDQYSRFKKDQGLILLLSNFQDSAKTKKKISSPILGCRSGFVPLMCAVLAGIVAILEMTNRNSDDLTPFSH